LVTSQYFVEQLWPPPVHTSLQVAKPFLLGVQLFVHERGLLVQVCPHAFRSVVVSLRVPSDWREAHRSADPADGAASPDDDVVFESASGEQRLAVSVWGAADRPPFDGWLPIAAVGMQPLDDGAVHADDAVPYNAFLGGEPAVVLGAAETPVSHLAYAAFLQHGERYVRVAWADMTGLTRPDDVLGALASFGWVGDDLITGSDKGPNQVPRLSLPQGVYWPSEALFGR
jgi:hypothetical protein